MKYEAIDYNWGTLIGISWEWNVWRKEGRDCGTCNHGKSNQHLKDQEYLSRICPSKIWRIWWSLKKKDALNNIYIFGRCVDMYAGCCWKLEDFMMKDHHKGNVDFNVHSFIFTNIWMGLWRDSMGRSMDIFHHRCTRSRMKDP